MHPSKATRLTIVEYDDEYDFKEWIEDFWEFA